MKKMTIKEKKEKQTNVQDYKTKIETENSQLQQRMKDLKEERIKALDTFNRTLDRSKTKVLTKFRDLKKVIDLLTTNLEDYKNKSLDADKNALNERLENLIGEITSGIEELKNDLNQLSTEQEEDLSSIYSGMGNQVSSGLTEIYIDQRNHIDQLEEDISLNLEEIKNEIMDIVRKEGSKHQEFVNYTSTSILDSLTTIYQEVQYLVEMKEKEINSLFLETISHSNSSLETSKKNLSTGLENATNSIDEILKHQASNYADLQDNINKDLKKSRSEVKKRIEKLRVDTVEEWKLKQNEQVKTLETIQDSTLQQYGKDLTVNESFQTKLLSDLEHQVKSGLYNDIDNISLSFNQFQDLFVNKIDALITRLTNFRDEINQNLDFLLLSNLKKIGEIGQQTEEYLSQLFSSVSTEYEKSRKVTKTSLSNSVKEHLGAITDYVAQFDNNLDNKLEKTTNDLNIALKDFHESTEVNTKENITKNNATLTQFKNNTVEIFDSLQNEQNINIEQTLSNLQNILQSKQSDMITSLNTLKTKTEQQFAPQRFIIKENKTESVRTGASAMNEINKEIETFQLDRTDKIKEIIEKTHHELDQFVKSSEEKVQRLTEGLEDNHKNKIVEFKSKASQEITEKQQLLSDYINSLEVKFTNFFEEQHQNLDQFISKSRSQKGTIDSIRNSLENRIEEVSSHIDSDTEKLQNNFTVNIQAIITSTNSVIQSLDDLVKQLKSENS
jgi:hypothetical protein